MIGPKARRPASDKIDLPHEKRIIGHSKRKPPRKSPDSFLDSRSDRRTTGGAKWIEKRRNDHQIFMNTQKLTASDHATLGASADRTATGSATGIHTFSMILTDFDTGTVRLAAKSSAARRSASLRSLPSVVRRGTCIVLSATLLVVQFASFMRWVFQPRLE